LTAVVIDSAGNVVMRDLTLGIQTPQDAEVISGVREGEWVAVGSDSGLQNGDTVCPKEVRLIRYRSD